MSNLAYDLLAETLEKQGIQVEAVKAQLKHKEQHIETPSWGYGNSGTRFGVFEQPGAARNAAERLEVLPLSKSDFRYISTVSIVSPVSPPPSRSTFPRGNKTDNWGSHLKQYDGRGAVRRGRRYRHWRNQSERLPGSGV